MSESAYQVAKFYTILIELPDIRTEIVDRFKKDIQAGTYEVPLEALVNIMVSKLTIDD